MSKLKNIKAVTELLHGVHRTQTRKTFGFSDATATAEKNKMREVGEVWTETDGNGNVIYWQQMNGYRRKSNTNPELSEVLFETRQYAKSFINCPKDQCTCVAPTRIDEKFRLKAGMCEECVIGHETKLKYSGKFNEYARNKMQKNADSFFAQSDKEVEELKRQLKTPINFVQNADGLTEKWESSNADALCQQIDEQYHTFKEKVKEKLCQ